MSAKAPWRDRIVSAKEVLNRDYPEPRYLVDGVLPDAGLIVLTGAKAVGKTFAMLSLAAGMATGGRGFGRLQCDQTRVLFLELELSARIMNHRMRGMGVAKITGLEFAFSWRPGTDGIQDLCEAIDAESYRVVFIDVLQRIWPERLDPNDYKDCYRFLGPLRELANEAEVCIVVATHSGKADRDDIMLSTIGSVGIQANSDVQLFLERKRGSANAVLHVHGNDMESHALTMRFDAETLSWITTDEDEREVLQSPERREILELLREHGPMKTKDIAEKTVRTPSATSNLLGKLKDEGLVHQLAYGTYQLVGVKSSSESGVCSVSAKEDTPH